MRSSATAAAVAAAFVVAGCSKGDKRTDDAAPAPVEPTVVLVTATDYAFSAPDTITSGPTIVRLVNHGAEAHHISMFRLDSAKTVQDLQALPEGASPGWLVAVGGPNAAMPSDSIRATLMLEPGNYVMMCFIPAADGKPHFMKGMTRPLTVVAATGPVAPEPQADVVVNLVEYAFQFNPTLTAGRHTLRINNNAAQPHEMLVVRMQPGKTGQDFLNWTNNMQGPPPGEAINGIAGMNPGQHAYISNNFTPGVYTLICFVPDVKDGRPHFLHGMLQDITVS
jgi:hypothetical protein